MLLWKYHLKMRTFVDLEKIIWRTGKAFVFGNPYNTVLAFRPEIASSLHQTTLAPSATLAPSEGAGDVAEEAEHRARVRLPVTIEE